MKAKQRERSVLVCGEALFDVFPDAIATADGAWPMTARAGGSPFNVAIGLARLGRRTCFLGGLSTDAMGEALAARLTREGVDLALSPRLGNRTTLSLVAKDAAGQPAYSFYGDGAADRSLTPAMLPTALSMFDALHVGSYSLVVEPVGSALTGLVARSSIPLVTFDPNIRPTVEPDMDRWRRVTERIGRHAGVVKLSAEDAGLLFPGAAPDRVAAELLAFGPGLVVVTDGARGATAWTNAATIHR
ncbi:MAG: PfkB family carbohydrate kinase, partial [Aestuariivirga sp.]